MNDGRVLGRGASLQQKQWADAGPTIGQYFGRGDEVLNQVESLRVRLHLHWLEVKCACLMRVFDRVSLGIILVGEPDTVVFANATAKPILRSRDGLAKKRNRLSTTTKESNVEFRRLLQSATTPVSANTDWGRGGGMLIPRRAPKRPLSILVAPLERPRNASSPVRGTAAVFVGDPDRNIRTVPELLRSSYGLTPAECRLAQLLVQGMSLPTAARQLGISTHTARSQSKSIFEKTSVSRQSELVRVLLHGPSLVRP